ncbi:response regulator [Chromobacterium violaceum]|uniref:response regulator n=1 Tax=Chromobacterium violaceum TaxID=536 RepID=UPI003DA9A6A4
MHLLIIEDDLDLGRALQAALKAEAATTEWARKLADADALFEPDRFDCVLLDLSLPDGSGLELLRAWRARQITVPVIMITASADLSDKLAGLDDGADDYLCKPFAVSEMVSRVRAVCRRSARQASEIWSLGALRLKPSAHLAWLDGSALDLSPREFRLLVELARDPSRIVSKTLLGQRLEPLGDVVDGATIEVHLSNLRRKIGAERIRTVRGVGYQYVV